MTADVRVPHVGDPDAPVMGVCRDCGPDHLIDPESGVCAGGCETCELSKESWDDWSPCAVENYTGPEDTEATR